MGTTGLNIPNLFDNCFVQIDNTTNSIKAFAKTNEKITQSNYYSNKLIILSAWNHMNNNKRRIKHEINTKVK